MGGIQSVLDFSVNTEAIGMIVSTSERIPRVCTGLLRVLAAKYKPVWMH
jgi:hypothetical protein